MIHSILKSISEGLENKSISQITYYVQYILIVTLVMSNFRRHNKINEGYNTKLSWIFTEV